MSDERSGKGRLYRSIARSMSINSASDAVAGSGKPPWVRHILRSILSTRSP